MRILVTGGAGYIGSHTCKELFKNGHTPVVVDNLCRGNDWSVKWGSFHKVDICDLQGLKSVLQKDPVDACIHFAGYAYVGESVTHPTMYFRNNVVGTYVLLEALKQSNVKKIVFSSSCATYGIPEKLPIRESTPQIPVNPYGMTKLLCEKMLKNYSEIFGFSAIALRYFNAAGADIDGEIGEHHVPETHLIPNAILSTLKNRNETLNVWGTDYPTADGTCVRDYIHVNDLASAHRLALDKLDHCKGHSFAAYNLGTGKGTSVRELIHAVEKKIGAKARAQIRERRIGDPPTLVADATLAYRELSWSPRHSDIDTIVRTAVEWHEKGI